MTRFRNLEQNEITLLLEEFNTFGYCIIRDFLAQASIENINELIEQEIAFREDRHSSYHSILLEHEAFYDLLFIEPLLYLMTRILGPNIKVSYYDLFITPENEDDKIFFFAGYDKATGLGFHRDGGRINKDLDDSLVIPRLSCKIAFWLTDLKNADGGNIYLKPGSHLDKFLHKPGDSMEGAIPLMVNHGDILIFDRRILHGRSINKSSFERRVIFLEYCVRWLLRKQDMPTVRTHTHIANQLLSSPSNPWENYWPSDVLPLQRFQEVFEQNLLRHNA